MIERQWLIERLRDIDWLTEILLIGIGIWLIQRFDWLIQRFDWWSYLWTSLININLHWLIDHNWYNWLIYCLILIDCVILIDWYDWLILIDWEIAWYWLIQRLRDVDWSRDYVTLIDWEIAWYLRIGCDPDVSNDTGGLCLCQYGWRVLQIQKPG